jgi:formate/nitrite transporter FocA (FNT family)
MEQSMPNSLLDAYAPTQIAMRVREVGVIKTAMPVLTLIALAVLAGAFLAPGALFFTITMTTSTTGQPPVFGLMRLADGPTFSLGLILVVVGGAELFTGNNLIAMAGASGRVTTQQVMRNWRWVYLGNLVGAVGTAVLVWLAGVRTYEQRRHRGDDGQDRAQQDRTRSGLGPCAWRPL